MDELALEFRAATAADAHDWAHLSERADAARLGRPAPAGPFSATVQEWILRLTHPEHDTVMATQDGRIVGTAFAWPFLFRDGSGREGFVHVSGVASEPALWGRGIARAVMTRLCDALRDRYHTASLWTELDNDRARRLYESLGWSLTGDTQTDRGRRMVRYELALRASSRQRD